MLRVVRDIIERYKLLTIGDRVVVAVSGGPDSVALTHVLFALKDEYKLELHLAHLNHMFRGREADQDAQSVIDMARELGLPYTVAKEDVPAFARESHMSAQAAARKIRYEFLEQVRDKLPGAKIATGHHADDQAETVLMNLLRGAGPDGLSGIPPKRGDVYIRPLIDITRSEIERYCLDNGLSYVHDNSNFKTVYMRNRIRLKLLPLLEEEYNNGVRSALIRLAHIMRDENDYIDGEVQDIWNRSVISENSSEIIFNLHEFSSGARALQRRMLRKAWSGLRGDDRDLNFAHVEQALDFLNRGATGGVIEFPRSILLMKSYNRFYLSAAEAVPAPTAYCQAVKIPGSTHIPELDVTVRAEVWDTPPGGITDKSELWLDMDLLTGPVYVRSRMPGDRFWPLGGKGSKKLKKFFVDEKVPREQRDKVPIFTTGKDIIWVGGMRPDNRWRITDKTRRFLNLKILENIKEQN